MSSEHHTLSHLIHGTDATRNLHTYTPDYTAPAMPAAVNYASTEAAMPAVRATTDVPVYDHAAEGAPQSSYAKGTTLIRPTFAEPSVTKHKARLFRALRLEDLG